MILVTDELYYEDLDAVYEELFSVEELPRQLRADLNYLGETVLGRQPCDSERINLIAGILEEEYPNIYRKYNRIITKALVMGECDGGD